MKARAHSSLRPTADASDHRRDQQIRPVLSVARATEACHYKQCCNHCRSSMYRDSTCRRRQQDDARTASEDGSNTERQHLCTVFWMRNDVTKFQQQQDLKATGTMVNTGATSRILTDKTSCKTFDSFRPGTHYVELADGTRCKGVAEGRGDAET